MTAVPYVFQNRSGFIPLKELDDNFSYLSTLVASGAGANVVVYGADPTGATLSDTAIQAAINASAAVYFPAGTYLIKNITLKANSYLFGDGEASILRQYSTGLTNSNMIEADSGSSSAANNLQGIVLRDLQLLGTVAADGFLEHIHLLSLNGVSDVAIDRVLFRGFRGDGLYVGSGAAGQERHNSNVRVSNCVFDGQNNDNRNAISILDCFDATIIHNKFVNCTRSNMPGAIDMEPDAYAWGVIQDILIFGNIFDTCGGNVGVISLSVPAVVTYVPRKIKILYNEFRNSQTSAGAGDFTMQTYRAPTATSIFNEVEFIGNQHETSTGRPFQILDGKGLIIRDNCFSNFAAGALLGYTGGTQQTTDVEIYNNRFVKCASTGDGIGLDIYTVTDIALRYNWFVDCGTGTAGTSNAIDFNTGISGYILMENNAFSAPTGKTLVAVQKEAGHTFNPSQNRYMFNINPLALPVYFQAEETDESSMETSYTCVVTGSTSAGSGSYTDQYAYFHRIGKQVWFRIKLTVSAGHSGTGIIQVGLPFAAAVTPNNEETTCAVVLGGVSSTGGHVGLINPAVLVGGKGVIRCYNTATGTIGNITIPAGSFTVNATGSFEAA